jgi:hypothetical protein
MVSPEGMAGEAGAVRPSGADDDSAGEPLDVGRPSSKTRLRASEAAPLSVQG